jgi:hypothetical protein
MCSRCGGRRTLPGTKRAFAKPGYPNEARADDMGRAYEAPAVHNAGWRHGRMAQQQAMPVIGRTTASPEIGRRALAGFRRIAGA